MRHLESKTVAGFITLLVCVMVLAFIGKLTPEAVDAIKWVGGAYFGVRGIANFVEPKFYQNTEDKGQDQ